MPKIVGFIGTDALPVEPQFAWAPTIMAGLTSYAMLLLASVMPGRNLVPNAAARLAEFKPEVLARIEGAVRAARAGERPNPVPVEAIIELEHLQPARYSFDTDRHKRRRYKAKTSLHGAMRSTSKAASESGHPHMLIDTRGAMNADGTLQQGEPVLLREYRADGFPTFAIERDAGVTSYKVDDPKRGKYQVDIPYPAQGFVHPKHTPEFIPTKEQRAARKKLRAEQREQRDLELASSKQLRAERRAKREEEREKLAAKRAERAEAAKAGYEAAKKAREAAALERKETAAEKKLTSAIKAASKGIAGPLREEAAPAAVPPKKRVKAKQVWTEAVEEDGHQDAQERAAKTSKRAKAAAAEAPAPVAKEPVRLPRAAKKMLQERERQRELAERELVAGLTSEEIDAEDAAHEAAAARKREEKLNKKFQAQAQAAPPAPAEEKKADYLLDYSGGRMKDQVRIITSAGELFTGSAKLLKILNAAGIKPGDMFSGNRDVRVTRAPDVKLTPSQSWTLKDIKEGRTIMKNPPRWGRRAAGLLVVARDTGRMLLMFRSADVMEPHTWGLPGGKCDGDDSDARACAVREFQEETGYGRSLQVMAEPVHVYREPGFEFSNYVGFVDSEFEPELDWENEDSGWFAPSKLPQPTHFGVRELFRVAGKQIRALVSRA